LNESTAWAPKGTAITNTAAATAFHANLLFNSIPAPQKQFVAEYRCPVAKRRREICNIL
jgi:hypothetical protein